MAIIAVVVMCAVGIATSVTFVTVQKAKPKLSPLLARNIEAMAESEDGNRVEFVLTATHETTIKIPIDQTSYYNCKILERIIIGCEGSGNLPCNVWDSGYEGEPYDCHLYMITK